MSDTGDRPARPRGYSVPPLRVPATQPTTTVFVGCACACDGAAQAAPLDPGRRLSDSSDTDEGSPPVRRRVSLPLTHYFKGSDQDLHRPSCAATPPHSPPRQGSLLIPRSMSDPEASSGPGSPDATSGSSSSPQTSPAKLVKELAARARTASHSSTDAERRGRLILVSNRLPCTISQDDGGRYIAKPSAGGLATGLIGPHRETGGRWIGWTGIKNDEGTTPQEVRDMLARDGFVGVGLSYAEYESFYLNFANSCIWPLFHYFTEKVAFTQKDWEMYVDVNRKFADAVLSEIESDEDYVFVQDYHFMLVPQMLREARPHLRIGFFLHIPFPSSEIFRIFPKRKQLLDGLIGADVIGFHTLDYVRHFRTTLSRVMGLDFTGSTFEHNGRSIRLMAEPLGVDPAVWRVKTEEDEELAKELADLTEAAKGRKIILGVERLDYSKGIPERLAAFRDLLKDQPELADKVMYIQITVPSRIDADDYRDLKMEIDRLAGEINGTFGRPGWQPLHYQFRGVGRKTLLAMYRLASVCLVTPLRDGLNLVAKEFVAANMSGHGTLVLGEFAGVAWELGEAIKVNPYDPLAMKHSIEVALNMPEEEQERRMQSMQTRVLSNTIFNWTERMLAAIRGTCFSVKPQLVAGKVLEMMLDRWTAADQAYLFLDYDGSLREFTERPEDAVPDESLYELLQKLAKIRNCSTWIVSGRDYHFLDQHLGTVKGLGLIAEHGAFIRRPGEAEFVPAAALPDGEWREDVLQLFQQFVQRVPGSHIETKPVGLAWHYRGADRSSGVWQARELYDHLQDMLPSGLDVMRGNQVVEVRPAGVNKAHAVMRVLNAKHQPGLSVAAKPGSASDEESGEPHRFALVAGDDVTDESMFRAFPNDKLGFTVLVGKRASAARYRVSEPADLRAHLRLLCQLAKARGSVSKD